MSLLQLHEGVDRISDTWLLNFLGHVEDYLGTSVLLHSTLYSRFVVGPKSSGEEFPRGKSGRNFVDKKMSGIPHPFHSDSVHLTVFTSIWSLFDKNFQGMMALTIFPRSHH